MLKSLKDKLYTINQEISTKLIPENIKEDVTILNVTGTLSPSGPMTQEEYDEALLTTEQILGGTPAPLYTELEYIQSSGTQWIKTEFDPIDNYNTFIFSVDSQILQLSADTYTIHGTGNYYFGVSNSNSKIVFAPNSELVTTNIVDDGSKHRYTINALSGKYSYDSQEFSFSPAQSSGTHKPFIFFGFSSISNNEVVANSLWSGRLYEAWIYNGYENDNITPKIINHFIPVKRASDNEICMYDTITNQFFTNQGTGNFIAGPEVQV